MLLSFSVRRIVAALCSRLGWALPPRARRCTRLPGKAALRSRPALEVLESRLIPAIASYNPATHFFQITGVAATATVTVSTPGSSTDNVQIDLAGDTFTQTPAN